MEGDRMRGVAIRVRKTGATDCARRGRKAPDWEGSAHHASVSLPVSAQASCCCSSSNVTSLAGCDRGCGDAVGCACGHGTRRGSAHVENSQVFHLRGEDAGIDIVQRAFWALCDSLLHTYLLLRRAELAQTRAEMIAR